MLFNPSSADPVKALPTIFNLDQLALIRQQATTIIVTVATLQSPSDSLIFSGSSMYVYGTRSITDTNM